MRRHEIKANVDLKSHVVTFDDYNEHELGLVDAMEASALRLMELEKELKCRLRALQLSKEYIQRNKVCIPLIYIF
jgi:hypothetical protein